VRNMDEHRKDQGGLWTVEDVAGYLKVSRSWVYQRAASGLLPCLHFGGCLRFDPAEVKAFVRGGPQKGCVVALRTDSQRYKPRNSR
jgi:excisionase family DNA binding protein